MVDEAGSSSCAVGERCYLGVDVGTGSARAGVFDAGGKLLGAGDSEIETWRQSPDFVEQSSADIWRACCAAVRLARSEAEVEPERVRGLGFDATCSLAALDEAGGPVTVSPSGSDERNVIVWMDHRAVEEAARIDRTGHEVLRYVGGTISPEMETPKLLWLKENLPETWRRAARFYDLPDLLVHLATGADVRSLCSTVCKWTYLGHEPSSDGEGSGRWDDSFFEGVGLGDLAAEGYRRIGRRIRPMGEPVGNGLHARAAADLDLVPGTPVGVSIIDAHAGGLGVLGAAAEGGGPSVDALETRLALIGGTSSCHMAVSRDPRFIAGVWGPYFSAMVPGLWLNEGGQSATGALVDHVIFGHARSEELAQAARSEGRTVYDLLNDRLEALASELPYPAQLTRELHVLPYFHGNRSPRADPSLRGVISGLRLSDTVDDLALLYLATLQAIAYGTRHIVESLNEAGYRIADIRACGGGTKNPLFLREHADATGCLLVLSREPEAVLLGSAILASVAAGDHSSVLEAMSEMSHVGATVAPAVDEVERYHATKYEVFQRMYDDFIAWRRIMA